MTEDHLAALLAASEAKKDDEGWLRPPDGRHMTLYVGCNGSTLTVSKIEALRAEGTLLKVRTVRGETYVLATEDVFAGAVEGATTSNRKAGFL